jgi:hypothetical protein
MKSVREVYENWSGSGNRGSMAPSTSGSIAKLYSAGLGQLVTRHTMPIARPPTLPMTANSGMITMAQIIPSMKTASVPVTNSAVATQGAQR